LGAWGSNAKRIYKGQELGKVNIWGAAGSTRKWGGSFMKPRRANLKKNLKKKQGGERTASRDQGIEFIDFKCGKTAL